MIQASLEKSPGMPFFYFIGNYSALFLYNIDKNVEKNMFFGIKKDYH